MSWSGDSKQKCFKDGLMLVWYHVDYKGQLSHYYVPGQASSKGLTSIECTNSHTFITTITENYHTFVGPEGNFFSIVRQTSKAPDEMQL